MSQSAVLTAPEAPESAPDRRREPRLRSLLSGTIVFDNNCTMDCIVRNISAYGAKVILADAYRLPEEFNLRIPHHDQTHHARVVWRKGDTAGFTLSDAEDISHKPHHRLTRREAERQRRKELDAPMF